MNKILAMPPSTQKRVFLVGACMLFCSFFTFAQNVDLGGKLTFLNYYAQDKDPIFLGSVTLNLTTSSAAIKAYVSANYTESSIVATTPNLDKAYVKIRLPFLFDKTMRLNVGKMPLAWGYGQVYNAGDLVFGALPTSLTSSSASSSTGALTDELRSDTEWMMNASVPLVANICNFEPIAVIPMVESTSSETSTIDENRFGGRFFFTPYIEQLETFELGYLANTDLDSQKIYAGLDGSLYIDYNLCSSIAITDFKATSDATKNSFALSNGLQKIITFTNYETGKTHALTLKTEELWYPYAKNIYIFAYTSFGITDTISTAVSLYSITADSQTTNTLSASFTITPIRGLNFGLSTSLADISEPTKNWATAISGTYTF